MHLRPILLAAADGLIGFGRVEQHRGPFRFPETRPVVLIVADDVEISVGPSGFDRKSLRRFLKSAGSAVVVSGAAEPLAYGAAVIAAIGLGRGALVVESREAHEPAWLDLIKKVRPDLPVLLSTPGACGRPLQ